MNCANTQERSSQCTTNQATAKRHVSKPIHTFRPWRTVISAVRRSRNVDHSFKHSDRLCSFRLKPTTQVLKMLSAIRPSHVLAFAILSVMCVSIFSAYAEQLMDSDDFDVDGRPKRFCNRTCTKPTPICCPSLAGG